MITKLVQILITPNQVLHNIILCILSFAETVFEFIFFRQILNISVTKKQKFIYITLSTICCILANIILSSPYLMNLVVLYIK